MYRAQMLSKRNAPHQCHCSTQDLAFLVAHLLLVGFLCSPPHWCRTRRLAANAFQRCDWTKSVSLATLPTMVAITEERPDTEGSLSHLLPLDPDSPVWADLVPVPQDDGPQPLCPILYDPSYTRAMDLFRALKQSRDGGVEVSDRALALTEHLARINPANYSVWNYRSQVLIEMAQAEGGNARLADELEFLDTLAHENMKNYQVWQHRRLIVSVLGDPSRELGFIAENLSLDAKNYHTWAYRQWVLAHFGGSSNQSRDTWVCAGAGEFPELWDGELDYVESLLDDDIRNNSAWNHRWFCVFARFLYDDLPEQTWTAKRRAEMAYTLDKIAVAPNNQSAWNYLRGLHRGLRPVIPMRETRDTVLSYVSPKDHSAGTGPESADSPPPALEWLLDSVLEQYEGDKANKELANEARGLLTRLTAVDPIRANYWRFRERTLS